MMHNHKNKGVLSDQAIHLRKELRQDSEFRTFSRNFNKMRMKTEEAIAVSLIDNNLPPLMEYSYRT
jgi:hypothetical protein